MSGKTDGVQDTVKQGRVERAFVCIRCPLGCGLHVSLGDEGRVEEVSGFTCAKGKAYAREEAVAPARMVTTYVCVPGCLEPLSVKTERPVPKRLVDAVLAEVAGADVKPPVAAGDIVCSNVCGTGVNVVTTKGSAGFPAGGTA